jgi:galactose-1-phosphate uridylyltransferase
MRNHLARRELTMEDQVFYNIMADGTVKQINPFTGTEVWAVPGRGFKPITNEIPPTAKKIEKHDPEDYCSFCEARLFEVPPEKARLIRTADGRYETLSYLPPEKYKETKPIFRRVPNLFEIVTIDYWRKNYGFRMTDQQKRWKEQYLASPLGVQHVTDILTFKLKMAGKSDEEIQRIHGFDKLAMADAFFGGGHELIIAHRHYIEGAEYDCQLYSSGEMTQEEHYWYTRFTIDAMKSIFENNRYARYISVFQNWLRPAGASFDHLHKQLVALDEWGSSIERQTRMLRDDPNVFNEYGANFAAYHNLVFAENDYAIAFVGIGHRFPTIEVFSRSIAGRPFEHTDEEIRGVSNLVHACHAAMGSQISCNEEWYYTPIDAVYKMPWHVLIKWRINVPAGFEGGTSIFINPMTPVDLRDKMVPRLYKLRDEGKINSFRVAEECKLYPNPLKYYLK